MLSWEISCHLLAKTAKEERMNEIKILKSRRRNIINLKNRAWVFIVHTLLWDKCQNLKLIED